MKRAAFKMQLLNGAVAEYKRRHDEIWPELTGLLTKSGISDYTIFLDEQTQTLFASQKLADNHTTEDLADNPLIKKWCEYMADIVEMDANGNPVVTPLPEMFHLE